MRMMIGGWIFLSALVFATSLLVLPLAADANPVSYCDNRVDYAVKVKGVEISPNPVERGKPAKFCISATTGDGISSGKLVIDVKYFGIHIHEETHELCKETSCPVSAGDFVLSHDQTLPSYAPPGSYTLIMKMLGDEGKQLTCITFDFSIGFTSTVADS